MNELSAYNVFRKETAELVKIYNASNYAYSQTKTVLDFLSESDNKNEFEKRGLSIIQHNDFNTDSLFLSNLEKDLCELMFVRAISALEVFLTDTLRDIFIYNKEPFKSNFQMTLTYGEILSTDSISNLYNKIINKECRSLSNGGFNEIIKYYKKNLKVDLSNVNPGKDTMQKYHDMRHLFVHRLGKVDEAFRKKYNLGNKKDGISITPEYLFLFIEDIESFANGVHILVQKRISELKPVNIEEEKENADLRIEYIITITSSENLNFLYPKFEFWINDNLLSLQNILVYHKMDGNLLEMSLSGGNKEVNKYVRFLKKAEIAGLIELELKSYFNKHQPLPKIKIERPIKVRKAIVVDEDILNKIKDLLPEQPWITGIHKEIAQKLGLKNKVVTSGIDVLIKKGLFKNQTNGILSEKRDYSKKMLEPK